MRFLAIGLAAVLMCVTPSAAEAQDVPPIFEAAPAVLYETYRGVDGPVFNEYFEMLVDKYSGSDGFGWGIYMENPTVAYRITALPRGMQTVLEVQQARGESFQEFTDAQLALWNSAWETRHVAVYNAMPQLSVVPADFTVADIQALPYNRVTIYHLDWDQAPAFRQALAARSALDREAGIDNFVLTAWQGGIGTEAFMVMLRVSAESRAADAGPNSQSRGQARQAYRAEWLRLNRAMNAAARHIERHDQIRMADLSFVPGN